MKKELYIIRHGQTTENFLGIVQGSGIDSSLNKIGIQQARSFYNFYHHIPFDFAFASNLQRTLQTIEPFLEEGLNYKSDENLREISWGVFEGQPFSETLKEPYELMLKQWQNGNVQYALEGGESLQQLVDRCKSFKETIYKDHNIGDRILICTHGRTLKCLLAVFLGTPFSEMERFKAENTGLFRILLHNNHSELLDFNDLTHLKHQNVLVS